MSSTIKHPTAGGRARPLSVEDRQAMIIDATMPLLVEYGPDLTSKQIADAAGVAEGTIFRAFGDKDTLIEATIKKFLDPVPLRRQLLDIPASLSLEEKMFRVVELMRKRFSDVFRVMATIRKPHQPHGDGRRIFSEIISEILAPHLHELNCSAEKASQVIHLLAFASSVEHFNPGMKFDSRELTTILLYGLAGMPSSLPSESTESKV